MQMLDLPLMLFPCLRLENVGPLAVDLLSRTRCRVVNLCHGPDHESVRLLSLQLLHGLLQRVRAINSSILGLLALRLVVQLISIHAFCSFPLGNSLPVLLGLDRRKLYLLGFRILGLIP